MEQKPGASQAEEAALVQALKAGDEAAYVKMVERYSPTIYNLALRMTGNREEAEEVLQETFLSAFRAVGRFEGRSQLGTWLYRIAYNAAMMRLRRRQLPVTSIDAAEPNEDGEIIPRQLVDWGALPDEILLSGELRRMLDAAVASLPEGLRSVFVLRDIEGLSTAETAQVLGLSEANVKVRLHRARLALRERLSSYFATAAPGVTVGMPGGSYGGRM
jgi:RNA polymerase sigma-70 factor (ECF subfamily)